jgi:hypothetical protein
MLGWRAIERTLSATTLASIESIADREVGSTVITVRRPGGTPPELTFRVDCADAAAPVLLDPAGGRHPVTIAQLSAFLSRMYQWGYAPFPFFADGTWAAPIT